MKRTLAIVIFLALLAAIIYQRPAKQGAIVEAGQAPQTASGEGVIKNLMAVGHQFRQDDLPSIAMSPDGSAWETWLSFGGDRDDVAIRQYKDGTWGTLQWVPGTSGDSWLPQVAVDTKNRVWVVWSQMKDNNWDLHARRFDPAKQEWGALEQLTTSAFPDINPRLVSNGKGQFALVWQGFRAKNSNIFLKIFENDSWARELRITNQAANDWEPSVAFDSTGAIYVAYDSYRNGNYDVFLAKVSGGKAEEMAVANTTNFEARATVAVDTRDRVWVAYEEGGANWGKDQGYILRANPKGVQLGGLRKPRVKVLENGKWLEPSSPLTAAFGGGNVYQPHIYSDGKGSIWAIAKVRDNGQQPQAKKAGGQKKNANKKKAPAARGFFEYRLSHLSGGEWSPAIALPNSKGRSSTRFNAALDGTGNLWMTWDTDNRSQDMYHRPIREQIYAGYIPAVTDSQPVLVEAKNTAEAATPAHESESNDLKLIRSYSAQIGGRKHQIMRGDFHRHTELSWDGGGTADGSLQDFYRYMIDAASMDFGASTDHQGGAWPYWWWYTQKMTDMYHVPQSYVPIFGYERSAVYPNGHRNVFFARRSESRVTPFHMKAGAAGFSLPQAPMGDEPGVGTGELVENDTKLLYEDIKGRNGIAISHTSGTRMGTDWRDNNPELEPVVEIFQGARTNYEAMDAPFMANPEKDGPHVQQAGYQPEGVVSNAWAKGYKLGIIASSDHGSTHISYAMVYTDEPNRQGILDAIRKRHTYGATDNIILDVRMGDYFMGDEFSLTKSKPIKVRARGTRPVVKVEILKDSKVIYSTSPNLQNVDFEFTDTGDVSGRHYYYVRLQQEDKMIAWSSPFFINYK